MRKFGLIGSSLKHSFSKKYFTEKFEKEGWKDCRYDLYEISDISLFKNVLKDNPELEGINVTIPYKEKVISCLDTLDTACKAIGAVNCIQIQDGKLIGFNTDYIGFKKSLENWLGPVIPRALVLGTGGASKAVIQALNDLQVEFLQVSRFASKKKHLITYQELEEQKEILEQYHLIVNTTPLGTYPNTEEMPEIKADLVNKDHCVYDLVYNPEKTLLMRTMEAKGAKVKNGMEMLILQAEAAWEIWN